MDKQRESRKSVANAYFVLHVSQEAARELEAVQNEMSKLYNGVDRCLASPNTFHVTLVGAHAATKEDMTMLMTALESFDLEIAEKTSSLKGLGSWKTSGGLYCLFAELQDPEVVVGVACALSKHLIDRCGANIDGCFGSSASWVDVVTEDIFQPHCTIATVDPRTDGNVWQSVQAKSGYLKNKGDKKKLSAREKGKREGRREQVKQLKEKKDDEQPTFGREPKIFAHELHTNKKMVFGDVVTSCIVLESMFTIKSKKELKCADK